MTRAETEAELRARGLPVELLEHLRKVPLDFDEDPDPYGLMKDVTPEVEAFSQDSQPRRNPGRPKGSRNKMGSDLMTLVMQAATETGFIRDEKTGEMIGTGEEGALGYLKWAAIHKADRFISLVSRVMPQHVIADVTRSVMTRAETEAQLRERGLPVELLEHLRKAPAPLDFDEDPDPYKLMKNVTLDGAPDGTGNK